LVDQAVQVKTGEQLGNGVADRIRCTVGFDAPFHAGHRRLPAAHMAGDNRVGQQLAVNRYVAPELFQHGVGIGQIAAEAADAPKALGNGEVGGQVGGFEGNRAVGGFEFEVGFDHITAPYRLACLIVSEQPTPHRQFQIQARPASRRHASILYGFGGYRFPNGLFGQSCHPHETRNHRDFDHEIQA